MKGSRPDDRIPPPTVTVQGRPTIAEQKLHRNFDRHVRRPGLGNRRRTSAAPGWPRRQDWLRSRASQPETCGAQMRPVGAAERANMVTGSKCSRKGKAGASKRGKEAEAGNLRKPDALPVSRRVGKSGEMPWHFSLDPAAADCRVDPVSASTLGGWGSTISPSLDRLFFLLLFLTRNLPR